MQDITFNGAVYNAEVLQNMTDDDLLTLRNSVAEALGVSAVKAFKDHDTAVAQTTKALERFAASADEEKPAAKTPKAKKEPKEKKPRGLAKSAEAKVVKRPNRKMFSTIHKTGEHTGEQGREHRWPNYTDGMTIVDVIETEGTEPWDVYNWVDAGIMEVREPSDEQFAERKAAWYAKHGLTDPEVAKEQKRKEREEAKAKREAEAAEKREAREKAKAEKAAERERKAQEKAEAKAAKEKAKADAAAAKAAEAAAE